MPPLTKIFRIELTGGKDVEKDLVKIRQTMTTMATAISKAKGELAALLATKGDSSAISSLAAQVAGLQAKMKSLEAQRKSAESDAKTQAQTEKLLAEAKQKDAQATKELAQAELARTQNLAAQNKELDRQIAQEDKETAAIQKKKKELEGLPGSYNAIRNALNQLRPVIKQGNKNAIIPFQGQNLTFAQAIAEFKKLSAAEQDFRRQFTRDGTLVGEYASGIVDAFKRMNIDDIIKNQVQGAKKQIGDLEKQTQALTAAYRQAQQQGTQDLNLLERQIHDNVVETENLRKAVQNTEAQLNGFGNIGAQITAGINKNFQDLKRSFSQFVLSYVGFQAVFAGLQTGIDNAKTFSDQTTELEIQLNKAKGGADGLVNSLRGLDTRTKLTGLEEISNIALKAGATADNLLGVTKAVDVVKTAFGKDFGEIETGTETFVKLINIFYDDGQITEDRILKIGNSIRTLANETVASVPFINDFSGRMAGLRQVANVSLPQIIGLGAGFEEFKQSAEVSSSVLVKVIPQLARDIDTFAKITGLTREEFKKILQDNPVEALLKVSEGLVAGKGDIEVFANTLKEAGIDASRASTIIGTLGGKADIFRDRISRAGTAIQSTDAITDAFNRKNENLAATMDKLAKRFADSASSKGFQITLSAIVGVITLLISNIGPLLSLLGLLAVGWAVQNQELFILNARLLLVNAQLLAGRIALGLLTVVTTAYNAVLFITNGALTLVNKGLALFGITSKAIAGPLGIVLTILSLLGAAAVAFGRKLEDSRASLSEYVRLQRINAEITREANKATSEQIATMDGWIAVINSSATSADTKRKAIQKLIDINPAFRGALQGEIIDLNELQRVYGLVVTAIQNKARAEAAATLSASRQRKVADIAGLRQELEISIAQDTSGQSVVNVPLSKEQIDILKGFDNKGGAIPALFDDRAQIFRSRFAQVKSFLDKKEKEAIAIYQDYLKAQAAAEENLNKAEQSVQKTPAIDPVESVFKIFDRLVANDGTGSDFKELLKKIQEKKGQTDALSAEYKDLLALEAKVKDILKPKAGSTPRGPRNTEKQNLDDDIKAIEAAITEQRAAIETQLAKGLISEKDYYTGVRDITVNGEQRKIATVLDYQQRYKKALEKFSGELAKDVAESELKQIQARKEANQKLYDLDIKRLDLLLNAEQAAAGRDKDTTLLNRDLSNEDRLNVQTDYYDRLLVAQIVYNQKQSEAEKKYNITSVENAQKRKEELEKIIKQIQELETGRPEARQKDIQAAADRQLTEIKTRLAQQTTAILDSNKSYTEKARALRKLESDTAKSLAANDAAAAKIALEQAERDREKRLISEKEYLDKLQDYKTKEAALYKLTTDEHISSTQRFIKVLKELKDQFVENTLGIKRYSDDNEGEQERVKDATKQTQDTVKELVNDAYQAYFTNRAARIEAEKQDEINNLDRQKKSVLATATSEAEKETIERQYAKKSEEIEKRSAEKKRALALKQASIDFAVAVLKTFAQFGFPIGLIPVAALTVAYLFQRSQIQQQQFARGGALKRKQYGLGGDPKEVPVNGGYFGGRDHSAGGTDFEFGGQSYNAEVKEMNIIRTKDAPKNKVYTITGTQSQIGSAINTIGGGKAFQPGASIAKFSYGGAIGGKLKAPYFSGGAYLTGGNVSSNGNTNISRLEILTEQVLQAVYASDQKEVYLNPGKVTEAQKRKAKDTSVGNL